MWPEIQSRRVIVSPQDGLWTSTRTAVELTVQLLGQPSFALKLQFPRGLEDRRKGGGTGRPELTVWTCSASSEGRKAVAPDETTSS